ncbi:DNA mismatch repair endonuclease MutL [Gloeocapsopsis dulcis]|uniref:DNA mismatch repair protein MutL n=1 Tax=Gloeocapsopsis dulcis AAB1 = 1H9 TaxID=1433147 RepID=A0A6N8G276_9CHRO|nr:DNA mismatch repair endonuclease MutL [Gloeocapsopsis dulcis]MUL39508.1 DNA mismatch repair protein MutL [Gloeocapsopsis dulcis AAB1 = 1H9]WNN87306.1 DNA mismatch repair endonuclease MutL [Gloeocapsopsis dulcis]
MLSSIHTLPEEVINLIAAGEVIDSIAAVVRELVENSLDAGATRIVVALWMQQWRVRVTDNGCGIKLTDLQQAAIAHTTSKIRNSDDLWKISSLGFRGEALHSLTQLAHLEILSRPALTAEGWRVVYATGGEVVEATIAAIAPGTVVKVSDLFGNLPNYREGLPAIAQQLKAVQTTIQQIALCHPHVTWQVWHDDREWFTISAGKTSRYVLPQILRQVHLSDLQELKIEVPHPDNLSNCKDEIATHAFLNLVLGLPDRCHRHRPDWIKVAVNGRKVKLPEIEQTILTATARTLPRDRYPVCFLHLQVSPNHINWNRHPAKAEIYLHHLDYWQEKVSQAIEQALRINPATIPESLHNSRVGKLIKAAESTSGYSFNRQIQPDVEVVQNSNPLPYILKAVAQVNNTYIVAEHPGGLWLVEQHIAHERVLYEQLVNNWQLVPLEPSVILNNLSLTQRSQLERVGIEIESFGEQMWAIRNIPAMLQTRDDCADALLELSLGGDLQTAQVAVACRSAIRNGTELSLEEMQILLNQWQRTRNPRTCPHGRPIYLSLEESALSRFFRRHWVIGKSHGI